LKAAIEAQEAERLRLEEIEAENEEKRLQLIADAVEARLKAEEMARREQLKLETEAIDQLRKSQVAAEKEAKEAAQAGAKASS